MSDHRLEPLTEDRLEQATAIWLSGWHEAHRHLTPPALVRLRTADSFQQRLRDNMPMTRIAVRDQTVLGLCITRRDELYQMYVAPEARGTGAAQDLMRDAETRMRAAGHDRAWLACANGNAQAARFYEKAGWINSGLQVVELDTSDGIFPLDCWVFRKALA